MRSFVHETPPRRVVFGAGAVERVADEVDGLGLRRILVIAGGSAAEAGARVSSLLGERAAGPFGRVRQHVPEALVIEAVRAAKEEGADGVCSVGGGSATGLAKAVAIELGLAVVAVPTTYAGSEMTPIYGITGEHKRTGKDPRAQPRLVVYDPALTVGLPARATASSGLNALAHAVAVLLADGTDPVAALHAEEGVGMLVSSLPAAVCHPHDLEVRGDVLYGAFLAAGALAAGELAGIHHRLCHILGGDLALVHADVHAALLPHTLAYERDRGASGIDRLVRALDVVPASGVDPAAVLHALAQDIGAPTSLAELGMPEEEIPRVVRRAQSVLGVGDRDRERVRVLLGDAHAGRPPRPEHDGPPREGGGAR
jgi:maleylacetate reductase